MIRQRALAWAAVLALVATVQSGPVPARFSTSVAALAQDDSAADTGEPADLAIVALHCAEAPITEALTTFFAEATLPARCAPAVGVTLTVTENGDAVSDSPFTTGVDGTVTVPVGLGSAIEVREDLKSLPAGYEPLTREANGVPYANPVRLDPAVAGAAVLFVNVPSSVVTELAQGSSDDAGELTDLAVVALQCADAPATEALTSYFTSGTPPTGCAPAEGVSIAVTENEKPLSGSPFQTDADGTLAVRIGLGSEVTVKEDPKSLPSGYVPLTQEVNGVPYANPVRLDSAVAGAAVLFVNVPTSVAARLEGAPAVDVGQATSLAQTITGGRTGCDPAYPDERTCIAPGRPLAEPCSITDQRNFTVLAPDPRGLDADGDGIGCEPISSSGGTILRGASFNLYTSRGDLGRAAPARTTDLSVSADPVRTSDGDWVSPPEDSRTDVWFADRDRERAGLWFRTSDRGSTGSLTVVSNPIFIRDGLWSWPNRHDEDDWFWRSRNHDGIWFSPDRISVGNVTVAGSGNGNVAIASNPVFIDQGLWRWPDHGRDHDWFWRNRFGRGVWGWPDRIAVGNLAVGRSGNGNIAVASNPVFIGRGVWSSPNHFDNNDWFGSNLISVGNITVAGSGNGNVAIASNPVFISHGVWAWPNRPGNDDWFLRSRYHDDRFWPDDSRDDDWRGRNRFGKGIWGWPSTISVGNLTIAGSRNGNVAIASNPVFISSGVWHWPGHINNRFWGWPNRTKNGHWRWPNHTGKGVWGWPSNIFVGNITIARSSSGNVAIVSNPIVIRSGVWFVAPDRNQDDHWLVRNDRDHDEELRQGSAGEADQSDVEPMVINGGGASEAPPSKIETLDASEEPALTVNGELTVEPAPADSIQAPSDGSTEPPAEVIQPSSDGAAPPSEGYVASPSDGAVAPSPEAPVAPVDDAGAVEPADVAPDTNAVDPSYVDPGYVDAGNVDSGYIAPDPSNDPGDVAPEPTYVDAASDPGFAAPEPSYVDPGYTDPDYVDPGYVAPDPGIEPSYSAPQPSSVDPGVDAGYVAPEPSYIAPEPNYVAPEPSYVDAGNVAANPGMGAAGGPDPSNSAPEPSFVDPGVDAGYVDSGNTNAGNVAPDPGMDAAGTVDAGNGVPESGDDRGGRGKRNNRD